eukprot:GHVU01205423.1.p1 GENE.GHVU01205423.1~~GHVU01205423.1.p1  ORF type:complete len:100 (+),score=6.77 GHVU01205423.1:167-466(+)
MQNGLEEVKRRCSAAAKVPAPRASRGRHRSQARGSEDDKDNHDMIHDPRRGIIPCEPIREQALWAPGATPDVQTELHGYTSALPLTSQLRRLTRHRHAD